MKEVVNKSAREIEILSRQNPSQITNNIIGYIIPLGTIDKNLKEFDSNYQLIAYYVAKDFTENAEGIIRPEVKASSVEAATIVTVNKKLTQLAETYLDSGWNITIFNNTMSNTIEYLNKDSTDIEELQKTILALQRLVEDRLKALKSSSKDSVWKHEVIELFYTSLNCIQCNIYIDKSVREVEGTIGPLTIDTLTYDDYANGMRLLSNVESFATTKIRQHIDIDDKRVYPYVMKARVIGDKSEYRPIRAFNGDSIISGQKSLSGCTMRIVYNIVNKDYECWTFLSLPRDSSAYNVYFEKSKQIQKDSDHTQSNLRGQPQRIDNFQVTTDSNLAIISRRGVIGNRRGY